jgi:hypothetical protein
MILVRAFMVIVTVVLFAVHRCIPRKILAGPGDQPLEFSPVKPDPTALLADVDGDAFPFPFFKSRFVASRTNHVDSFS